ncbi:MAG: ABC transporter ATP-binding protein [Synergistaceae bacterium]|jgi:oligopeptide/dipeptide ABC transporter ATP-binding protein|nr:ABC transporter ATP-binding protein [Synergistaceae bacterium]
MPRSEKLLEVKELSTKFKSMRGWVTAVDGVSFSVGRGEILGIVGESGCGKSVTSQSIMRLYDEQELVRYDGEVIFNGEDLMKKSEREMERVRGNQIAMIFQDAMTALNPLYTIGNQIAEAVMIHQHVKKLAAYELAEEILRLTGIPSPRERLRSYPHELSGGMRQRAMIAVALACRPQLLISDESTTALDVTIQAQIIRLLVNLKWQLDMGIMLITHDLGIVAQTCQKVIIMYLGHIVEEGGVEEIFDNPLHPYTAGLLKSIPTMRTRKDEKLYMIRGTVPPLDEIKTGCRFYDRCAVSDARCAQEKPRLQSFGNGHGVRCFSPQAA